MPTGAFGAVRPVGAIPPTATAAGPSNSRSHGRLRRSEGPLILILLATAVMVKKVGKCSLQSNLAFNIDIFCH